MEVATLFLILISDATMATEGDREDSKTISLSTLAYNLVSFSLSQILKEIWSEKLTIILKQEENSELRGEKEGKHS